MRTLLLTTLFVAAPLFAQGAASFDPQAVAILRTHGLDQSKVMDHLSWLCDVHGPRLTGSQNLRNAQLWVAKELADFGIKDIRFEKWGPFGRGWRLDRSVVHVVGENPWQVLAWPKAWSPSLPERIEADVVLAFALDADRLKSMDLSDKVVFLEAPRAVSEPFEGLAKRLTGEELSALADQRASETRPLDRRAAIAEAATDFRAGFQRREAILRVLYENRPFAIIDRGAKGDYGTLFVTGASAIPKLPGQRTQAREVGAEVIPQITFAVEHYNRICRILEKGLPVRLSIELKTTFLEEDPHDYNLIADIQGTDPVLGDQVVMLGAHIDSWHAGTGCTDNGVGSAVMIEAMRLLRILIDQTGVKPRRTIRLALWTGEEQGLLGSRAYVAEHFGVRGQPPKPAHEKLSGYFNLDNGTGRIRGVYLQGNEAVAPIFRAWLRPFHDLDAGTLTLNDTGSTDHMAFDNVGLPGFQFIQDPVSYPTRTHHSNMDVFDHAVPEDLKQAAVIIASFAWHTAQRDQLLPRKPAPAPQPADAPEVPQPRR